MTDQLRLQETAQRYEQHFLKAFVYLHTHASIFYAVWFSTDSQVLEKNWEKKKYSPSIPKTTPSDDRRTNISALNFDGTETKTFGHANTIGIVDCR